MSTHIHQHQIERFYDRRLETPEMIAIWEHLDVCDDCHQLFRDLFQNRGRGTPITFNLSLEFWLRNEHFDYETIAGYVDETLDSDAREIAEIHLRACGNCHSDLESFIAFRKETEPEMGLRYGPNRRSRASDWLSFLQDWPRIAWKPAYTFVTLALIGLAIAASLYVLKPAPGKNSRGEILTGLTPPPSASASPSPEATEKNITRQPVIQPPPKPNSALSEQRKRHRLRLRSSLDTLIALNDGEHKISIDRSGSLTGLNDLSPEMRQSVREILLTGEIKLPDFLSEFNSARSALRGAGDNTSFKLLSPVGAVIAEDRPIFQWERLEGAMAYRVEVSDSPSREPLRSDPLPATTTEWTPPEALSRGKVYSWVVIATINGKEIVSPDASLPDAKFKVLGGEKARELNMLKQINSRLALGVFFAREGMIAEAEKEIQVLSERNPDLPALQRMVRFLRLKQVQ